VPCVCPVSSVGPTWNSVCLLYDLGVFFESYFISATSLFDIVFLGNRYILIGKFHFD
jgi:hypothetical protein